MYYFGSGIMIQKMPSDDTLTRLFPGLNGGAASAASNNEGQSPATNQSGASSLTSTTTDRVNYRQQMNIGVLKRKDKFLSSIVATFDHVVLYKYNKSEWEKLDVEGAMFIVERNEPKNPKYRIVVMNRKSANDFHQDITKDLDLQVQLPFVFYKTKNMIRGLWFYKSLQSIEFNDLIVSLKEKSYGKQIASPPEPTTGSSTSSVNVNGLYSGTINQQQQQPSSNDASSFLKSMLGIGGNASVEESVLDQNQQPSYDGTAMIDEEALMKEQFYNNGSLPQQSDISGYINNDFAESLAKDCTVQFSKRKFVTKEMFINQLIYTLESNQDFANTCYDKYCQMVSESASLDNKPSSKR